MESPMAMILTGLFELYLESTISARAEGSRPSKSAQMAIRWQDKSNRRFSFFITGRKLALRLGENRAKSKDD
jgi:hypothetical protein